LPSFHRCGSWRHSGTQVYFFELAELSALFVIPTVDGKRLQELELQYDRRLLLNRKKQLKMYRVWCQGSWRCTAAAGAEDGGSNARPHLVHAESCEARGL
jgi:hypothetical protein